MLFVGVVENNDTGSDLLILRCRFVKASVASDLDLDLSEKVNKLFSKRKLPLPHQGSRVPEGCVQLDHEGTSSTFIPAETFARGVVNPSAPFRPKPHQQALVKWLSPLNDARGSYLIYWRMGLGKTKGVINLIRQTSFPASQKLKIVVICPKSVVLHWCKELKSLPACDNCDADRYTFYHVMCEAQLTKRLAKNANFLRDQIVIYDEVHSLRNATDQGRSIIDALLKARLRLLLTGTPIVNDESEESYLRLLSGSPKDSLEKSYMGRVHWAENTKAAPKAAPKVAPKAKKAKAEPQTKLVEAPPVLVPMTAYQLVLYFQSRGSTIYFGDYSIHTAQRNAYDTAQKLVSIYEDDENCPKMRALISNIKRFQYPQVVHSRYVQRGLDKIHAFLQKALPSARIAVFDGSVATGARQTIIKQYNAGKVDILLLSSAGNLGINLHNTQAFHNLEPFDNASMRDQTIARALRPNSYPAEPKDGKNNFLTAFTYVCTFPDLTKINLAALDAELKRKNNLVTTLTFDNSSQRLAALRDFLKDNVRSDGVTVDQKVLARTSVKQGGIDAVLKRLQALSV
jgi:superfamily II DNA or RNA helicase